MPVQTFKEWISAYLHENTPIGDLARDIAMDQEFPGQNTHAAIQKHLGHSAAAATFEEAWTLYSQN